MLEFKNVSKYFTQEDESLCVLEQASFALSSGKSIALQGESGSGKSTLLHMIAGIEPIDSGSIILNGQTLHNLTSRQWNAVRLHQLSLIFQQYHLVSTLTVWDNISLQARLAGNLDTAYRDFLITKLGLDKLVKRFPHQLSGGQQQRVAIARSMLHQPRLILADEPTGNLDEQTSRDVMVLLVDIVKQAGSSLLMVTHSSEMAAYLDEQWLLKQGKLSLQKVEQGVL